MAPIIPLWFIKNILVYFSTLLKNSSNLGQKGLLQEIQRNQSCRSDQTDEGRNSLQTRCQRMAVYSN